MAKTPIRTTKVSTTPAPTPARKGMDISAMGAMGKIRGRTSKLEEAEAAALGMAPKRR